MAKPDNTSKPTRSRRSQAKDPAATPGPVTAAAAVPIPSTPRRTLEEVIEYERSLLLQVRSMLHCLYEVLLYADDDESVLHAEVAQTAARLINDSAVRLDSMNLQPLINAIRHGGGERPYEDQRDLTRDGPYEVREAVSVYLAA